MCVEWMERNGMEIDEAWQMEAKRTDGCTFVRSTKNQRREKRKEMLRCVELPSVVARVGPSIYLT